MMPVIACLYYKKKILLQCNNKVMMLLLLHHKEMELHLTASATGKLCIVCYFYLKSLQLTRA